MWNGHAGIITGTSSIAKSRTISLRMSWDLSIYWVKEMKIGSIAGNELSTCLQSHSLVSLECVISHECVNLFSDVYQCEKLTKLFLWLVMTFYVSCFDTKIFCVCALYGFFWESTEVLQHN